MPIPTPRERLEDRVRTQFVSQGFGVSTAQAMAAQAVGEFYDENYDGTYYPLVAEQAVHLMMEVMPSFVTHMRAAFDGAAEAMRSVTRAAEAAGPYVEIGQRLQQAESQPPRVEYDASGLPRTEPPAQADPKHLIERRGEPCIEEGCGDPAVPGTAFCADCMPNPTAETAIMAVIRDSITGDTTEVPEELLSLADQISLEDTGRRSAHFRPYQRRPGQTGPVPTFEMMTAPAVALSRDNGRTWDPVPGVLSIEVNPPGETADFEARPQEHLSPPEVIELTEREFHLAVARRLRQLGCTYSQLKAMHDRRHFETAQHHSAWFMFGGMVNLEQLDRANFVIDAMDGPGGVAFNLSDHQIELIERRYPTDRITGAPHHFVVNGDHSECGCGGDHLIECSIWNIPAWRHKGSICGIARTLCNHSPRHHYGQPCDDYHENLVDDNTIGEPTTGGGGARD
jgi:hypothetical protein